MLRFFFVGIVLFPLIATANYSFKKKKKKRVFRHSFADPREIRMALSFQEDSRVDAWIGNYFTLFGLSSDPENPSFYMGLEGGGRFTMRRADNRFPLETADGTIGTYIESSYKEWSAQLRYTHISAHIADGISKAPIAYSRESMILKVGYVPTEEVFGYLGVGYLVNSVPNLPKAMAQLGGHAFWMSSKMRKLSPFAAWDLQWRQEASANPSFCIQLGMALNNPPNAYESFRFFYSYYTGMDPRGQFYDELITAHSFGIEMQI